MSVFLTKTNNKEGKEKEEKISSPFSLLSEDIKNKDLLSESIKIEELMG